MSWLRSVLAHAEFRAGVRAMSPQTPGLAAWGLMTGVTMMKSGLSLTESLAMALFVFAGSSQLASLPLLVAGAPFWVILAAGFCVNLRFVVFSLHLRRYMMHMPLARRLFVGYLTIDMTYVIHTRRFPEPGHDDQSRLAQDAFLMGNCVTTWVSWMLPSVLGIVLANLVPTTWGLGFAGILCLVGMLCALATTRLRVIAAAVAGATALATYTLPLKLNIIVAIGVAVLACMSLENTARLREAPR